MALANHHYSLSTPAFFLNRDTRIPDRTLSINYLQASETSNPNMALCWILNGWLSPRYDYSQDILLGMPALKPCLW